MDFLTVEFGSSLTKAHLKFYPAIDDASSMVPECLIFFVLQSSPAVRLLVIASDTSDNIVIGEVHSQSNVSDRYLVVAGTGRHSINVLRGRQYVVFTAEKIKVTRTSDAVRIFILRWTDGPCVNDDPSK